MKAVPVNYYCLSRAVMESALGSEGVCSLKLARCSGIRLIVSCHYQHETKVCDLSFCSVTALKTDGKPQGSSPSTLFEGFAGEGRHGESPRPPKKAVSLPGNWVGACSEHIFCLERPLATCGHLVTSRAKD